MPAKTKHQGLLYEQAAGFAQDLETGQQAAQDQMLAAWTDSYWGIRKDMDAFLEKVAQAKAAGQPPSPAWAFQQQRLKNLLDTTKAQIARYASDASLVTTKAQASAIQAAMKHAQALTQSAVAQSLPGLEASLGNVNPKALEHLVGHLADGSVLRNHLVLTLPAQAAQAVQDALVHGLAAGHSQDRMLRAATEALGISHTRATTILRTESLRAYRSASRAHYLANQDVIGGWTWHASLDSRTCVACAVMDGTEHPVDAVLDGHPRCRCAMVPRTKTWEELGIDGMPDSRPPVRSGAEWLESQSPAVQRAMMGRAKFNAWADGQITLDDMVARTYDPQWGTMRTERSLKAILEGRHENWVDRSSLAPQNAGPKPLPDPDPKQVALLADRYDLDYLQEWMGTPGNSPSILANVQGAINLKIKRLGRQGPSLPTPDAAKVKAGVDKLAKAVETKGYPSKGYSQSQAIYKAQANGTVGTQVGVVKSLTWEQKVTAQAILDEHQAALPALARAAEKKKALAAAHDEALAMHAQMEADKAADDYLKGITSKVFKAGDDKAAHLVYDLEDLGLADALKAAGDDPVALAVAKAKRTVWQAQKEAYEQAKATVQGNWTGTTWTNQVLNASMEVGDDGWAKMTFPDVPAQPMAPKYVADMLKDPAAGWTQHLVPDPANVKALTQKFITDENGYVDAAQHAHWEKQLSDGTLDGLMSPQVQTDLKEALDQASAAGKWKPQASEVSTYQGLLNDGTLTVEDLQAELAQTHTSAQDAANLKAAIQQHQAEQAAKHAGVVAHPVIDPAKVKWEKVSDAQVAKLVSKVQSGEQNLDDLYAAYSKSKNAGPKANYAKAIYQIEGKDLDLPPAHVPGKAPTPPSPGPAAPAWPTTPPWSPEALKDTGKVLGTHGARVYEAPDGTRWLFKPPKDPKDGFLTTLDETASRFQSMAGLKAPDTYVVTLGGRRGSIQRMFDATDGFPNGFQPAALSKHDLDAVQREHVLDWFLSNHDGHRDQFLRLPDGTLTGIDKGQAFRWFGQDRLDWEFHPNQAYGAPEPVYNTLWRDFAAGKDVDLDPPGSGALWDQIKAVQAIPDDQIRDMFREYAEQAASRGLLAKRQSFPGLKPGSIPENDVNAFLDAIVQRKHDLEKDFTDLYERAAAKRAKALPGWTPKAATPKVTGTKAKWVGKDKPEPPTPPTEPTAATAHHFDTWLQDAKARYTAFSGKDLEASNNWARFRRVVDDLDATAAKELLDRSYLDQTEYDRALALIDKAKAERATLEAAYKKALADHATAMDRWKKDLGDWKDANGVKDLTQGMNDAVVRHDSDDAGVRWAAKHFAEDRYNATQRKWLRQYTGSDYSTWNSHLRATEGRPTQYEQTYKHIDKAMEAQPIPEDVILHRGTTAEGFKINGRRLNAGDDLSQLIGSVQVDHGYMSTSVGNSAAFSSQPVQLKIRTPGGTPGAYVQMFSQHQHERELILARGTHMYVHNAYKRDGKWFLEVEVVPEGFDPAAATPMPSTTPWSY